MKKPPRRFGSRDNPSPDRDKQSNLGSLRRTNVFDDLMALYRKCEPLISRIREVIQLIGGLKFVWNCCVWCSKHILPVLLRYLEWLREFV